MVFNPTKGTVKKNLLAAFLGVVIFFIWSAAVRMNPLIGMMGLSLLKEKEDMVVAAVSGNVPLPGLHFFPGIDPSKCTPEQRAAWTEEYKAGPTGLLMAKMIKPASQAAVLPAPQPA